MDLLWKFLNLILAILLEMCFITLGCGLLCWGIMVISFINSLKFLAKGKMYNDLKANQAVNVGSVFWPFRDYYWYDLG